MKIELQLQPTFIHFFFPCIQNPNQSFSLSISPVWNFFSVANIDQKDDGLCATSILGSSIEAFSLFIQTHTPPKYIINFQQNNVATW